MMQLGKFGGTRWKSQYNNASVQTTGRGFTVPTGTIVTLSGWYDGNKYYIVEYPNYYISIGEWAQIDDAAAISLSQSQNIINKLLKNNQYIFENNLLLARYSSRLNSQEKTTLYNLQKRLENRDNLLREADVFSALEEARVMGYSNYQNYLNQFMASGGVGLVISTTTAIIIGAVVVASLSTTAYFAFSALYEESVKDVELSREMLKVFEKYNMSEEDIAVIEEETQGIVSKAVLLEKINTTFGNIKTIVIGAALAYVGYKLYEKYK